MARIEKKVWSEYFRRMTDGTKTFDVRLNDFEAKEGDIMVLREYDPARKKYTGRSIEKKIGFVLKFKPYAIPFYSEAEVEAKGLQIISLL